MIAIPQKCREYAERYGIDEEFLRETIEEESKPHPRDDEGDEVDPVPLDAQAAQANREIRTWNCSLCEGAHFWNECHLFDNIPWDELRKMPHEDAKKFLDERGLGKFPRLSLTHGTAVDHNEETTQAKRKAGEIENKHADSSSRGCSVERKLCRICENDHPTRACPYRVSIQRGEKVKVSSEADIICRCCNQIGAHPEDSDTVEFFAVLRVCDYCNAVGEHEAQSLEDCPDKEAIENKHAGSSLRGCAVERKLCRICESDHLTRACPYRVSIPRGVKVKVSSQADIICRCCSQVGAHPEDPETVEFFAVLKVCDYCDAVGEHEAQSPEDCPNKEAMEPVKKHKMKH